ncbi:hypothetical protein [Thermococcus sp.]
MRKRTLLGIFVVLLVVGAYVAYALNNSKLPEVKGCVNPFREVKPVSKTAENWSRIHVFFKAVLSGDIRGLAKPWEIDYKNVKIVKHTLDYNGEKITMLAMGIPLKDGKHVIAYYEFSKPIQGVKTRAYLLSLEENKVTTQTLSTNGYITPLSSCAHECSTNSDCSGVNEYCEEYCCARDWDKAIDCCLKAGYCAIACAISRPFCIACIVASCASYCMDISCLEWGTVCVYHGS